MEIPSAAPRWKIAIRIGRSLIGRSSACSNAARLRNEGKKLGAIAKLTSAKPDHFKRNLLVIAMTLPPYIRCIGRDKSLCSPFSLEQALCPAPTYSLPTDSEGISAAETQENQSQGQKPAQSYDQSEVDEKLANLIHATTLEVSFVLGRSSYENFDSAWKPRLMILYQ